MKSYEGCSIKYDHNFLIRIIYCTQTLFPAVLSVNIWKLFHYSSAVAAVQVQRYGNDDGNTRWAIWNFASDWNNHQPKSLKCFRALKKSLCFAIAQLEDSSWCLMKVDKLPSSFPLTVMIASEFASLPLPY